MLFQRKLNQPITLDWLLSNGITKENGCMIWSGKIRKDGYGSIKINKKQVRVNRVIAEYVYGKSNEHVLHTCDNPSCMNPNHLYYGGPKQNALDARDRNRRPKKQKLTKEQAYLIKYFEKDIDRIVAEKYGIARSSVNNIRRGYSWKDI